MRPCGIGKPNLPRHWLKTCVGDEKAKSAGAGTSTRHTFGCVVVGGICIVRSIALAPVDVMLSEHRDLAAARAFFRSAKAVTGVTPDRVTTDGHDAYPRAIRTELGRR